MIIPHSIVVYLSKSKADHRIIHIIFSRVHEFLDIGMKDGIDKHRLCETIYKQEKKMRINKESCLKILASNFE